MHVFCSNALHLTKVIGYDNIKDSLSYMAFTTVEEI